MNGNRILRDVIKRAVDVIAASAALVVLSPVMGTLWLLVRNRLGTPVIFAQQRPGKDGELFTMYKFRTMLPEDASRGWVTDDQRMTDFGRRLRSTSLDELPTLVNVLKGDMSLVGPRPLVVEYLSLYSPHQARRHEVRPGVTGLAQVKGRNSLSWEERFDLDVHYVDHHNLWLDVKILAQTVRKVLSKSDVQGTGITTMTMFVGSAPQDGLTEHNLTEQHASLFQDWLQDPRVLKIGNLDAVADEHTRYWYYTNERQEVVGIGGLFGLGSLNVDAVALIGADYEETTRALLNRLIRHARSYDVDRMVVRIVAHHDAVCSNMQTLGFVAANDHDSLDHSHPSDYLLSLASRAGA